jgi:hypothetical protein
MWRDVREMTPEKPPTAELRKSTGVNQPPRSRKFVNGPHQSKRLLRGDRLVALSNERKRDLGLLISLHPIGHVGPTRNGPCLRRQLEAVNDDRKLSGNELKGGSIGVRLGPGGLAWGLVLLLNPS